MRLILGDRLKSIRKAKNLTQQQMSIIMHITLRAYQRYENNEQKPAYDKIARILDEFKDLNLAWIFTGEGEMFKFGGEGNNAGVNPEFIKQLAEDLQDKDDSFYASLSISKEKMLDVMFGRKKLTRIEVIELAQKLNKPLNEYMALAGYMPEGFKKIVGNKKAWDLFRSMSQLTDAEISQVIDSLSDTIRQHFKNKEKNKKTP